MVAENKFAFPEVKQQEVISIRHTFWMRCHYLSARFDFRSFVFIVAHSNISCHVCQVVCNSCSWNKTNLKQTIPVRNTHTHTGTFCLIASKIHSTISQPYALDSKEHKLHNWTQSFMKTNFEKFGRRWLSCAEILHFNSVHTHIIAYIPYSMAFVIGLLQAVIESLARNSIISRWWRA